jgi:hypothetical protein
VPPLRTPLHLVSLRGAAMASSLADLEGGAINMAGIRYDSRCACALCAGDAATKPKAALFAALLTLRAAESRSEAGRRELLDALDAVRRRLA